ncbi:protein-L-isoaspartate O-methyltransferase family protein [Nocardiopsis algeriensis]|uniref:Protein-L-isoaspartate O-methyltransferase n=1 Tax=Nocardiopsis algeriensis TaxID=1478215 RepID=A0A841IVS6_9ACTN|nr:methyltransferase domain-containing protein [Nocardiopsis algeriensis]MBB6122272.1 protein-L-isoaspartate(D-aspartate) O-methyltransferase [Nocardiopsis algeriensis]
MSDDPQVRAALTAVDEDHYTLHSDGSLVRQSTAASSIARMLERLDVRPGMRVLEIGTGSGFSSALLGELVGPEGTVVSVDVVAELTERARDLHKAQGRSNIELVTGDGALGAPGRGPFDRIVAWATPRLLPEAWMEQAEPGAVVLTPVELAPSVRTAAILRARVNQAGVPEGEEFFAGRYVEMHGQELEQWLVPPRGVNALVHAEDGRELWISAPWAAEDGDAACDMLAALADEPTEEVPILKPEESAADLTAYLYARHAEDISVIGLGGYAWGVGRADADGAAVFAAATPGSVVHGGGPGPLEQLRAWIAAWREADRPGYADLKPVLTRKDEGWRVRAQLSNT